ncbi:MAG TPA: hypothetical protein PKW35_22555 [Nannocystaceae bacterium]|nr:hypothetical protein [Nannocystaceae bacterium]
MLHKGTASVTDASRRGQGRGRQARRRGGTRARRDRAELPGRDALVRDWICEVLSPSTQGLDRADKMSRQL